MLLRAFVAGVIVGAGLIAALGGMINPSPPVCFDVSGECTDGLDNDTDGLVDCLDLACLSIPVCVGMDPTTESAL